MTLNIYYTSKIAIVRDSIKEDCVEVAKRIRQQDREEIWASNHLSPIEATLACFNKSTMCLTIERSGFAVAMFGIVPHNLIGGSASIWLITTNGILGMDKSFVRRSRTFINYFLTFYPLLYSYVDVRNKVSIKWLKYLGAKLQEAKPYGLDGLPFNYFTLTNDKEVYKNNMRQEILSIENKISKIPGVMFGDCFPLKHNFCDGIYTREISIPKGHLLVSKIHKFSHPVFILEGDISILSEDGIKRIKAPCMIISPVGAKRIGYAHENTKWVTVHRTNETDLERIEEELIAKSFDELSYDERVFIDVFTKEKT